MVIALSYYFSEERTVVELRHLRYFVAVAEELHFGRAAKRLHIVQPTLSAQIIRLEGELGVPLFYRTKRRVELTSAGEAFLPEARRTLEGSERAIREARRAASGETGRLTIGLVGSATYSVLTEVLLGVYRERFPDVTLAPREMNTVDQVEALHEGTIEVGFLRPPSGFDAKDLKLDVFIREPMVAVLPKDHRLATLKLVPLKALAGEPFVLPSREREPGFNEQVTRACQDAGFAPKVAQEVTEMQVGLSLTASGMGMVGLLPASIRNIKAAGITFKKLAKPVPEMDLYVAWRPETLSPAARAFLNVAAQVARRQF